MLKRSVVIVGPFPPPVHGMAVVNAAVLNEFELAGLRPLVINIAAQSLKRSFIEKLKRLPTIIKGLCTLAIKCSSMEILYMSISGSLGQFFEILFLILARINHMQIYLHHHSYAYIDQPKIITKVLMFVSGRKATHIVLSPGMETRLKQTYDQIKHTIIISNSAILSKAIDIQSAKRTFLKTIGFIGNISPDKGIFEFLATIERLRQYGLSPCVKLAGPFQDKKMEQSIRGRLELLPNIEYVGPKYGAEKEAFWNKIDVLLFPTRYLNEADPLVIYEAMMHSIPVIASSKGAIGEIITPECGLVIHPDKKFEKHAVERIKTWVESSSDFQQASICSRGRFLKLSKHNYLKWEYLISKLST